MDSPRRWRGLLDQYCVGCHNDGSRAAGLSFSGMDLKLIPKHAEQWERVVRKLRAGAMPPLGMPRPDRSEMDEFVSWLENTIDEAAEVDPGVAIPRRLNRAEYATAVRDLLDLDVDVTSLLPADDANHGFDNVAAALLVSPAHTEAYLSASRKISRLAVGNLETAPAFTTYRARPDLGQDHHSSGLPIGTRGGLLITHNFPLDAEYIFKPRLAINTSAKVRGLDFPHDVLLLVDGREIHRATVGGSSDEEAASENASNATAEITARLEVRVPIAAGPHSVGVTFVQKTDALPDGVLEPFLRSTFDTQEQRGVPVADSISISGPFNPSGPGETPSRRKIFLCRPSEKEDELPCAKTIVAALASKAYRHPVSVTDMETLLSMFQAGRNAPGQGDRFEAGIESALRFVLASPEFLFRTETDPAGVSAGIHRVSDLDLASRLSFFLWSSIPDEELLQIAAAGKLGERGVLERQVQRMLNDKRARALATNFAGQWLYLRNLSAVARDLETFPEFDDNLRQGFRRETELFFESIVREDRNVLDLLEADYTFVNQRLAQHYGIPGVSGSYFRRVQLPGEQRRGLLGQGSILTVTSYATRTSPVLRGKWLLENVLGTPVPPPPPNIPALQENRLGAKPRSVRERTEEHRKNPACAVCHDLMDPLGFALENFDAIGSWRDRSESHEAIDAAGILVDGAKVNGPVTLRAAILSHPEAFLTTLTEKLLVYALGRGLEHYDMPVIRKIIRGAASKDYAFSSIVLGIVQSTPFQMKRSASLEAVEARTDSGDTASLANGPAGRGNARNATRRPNTSEPKETN